MGKEIEMPLYHKCGKRLGRKKIPVDKRVIHYGKFFINYCEECKSYVHKNNEFKDPAEAGDYVTNIQRQQNLKHNISPFTGKKSPFSFAFLEELVNEKP